MAVIESQIKPMVQNFVRNIEAAYPGLSLYFIIHNKWKLKDHVVLAEHDILGHPAAQAGRAILRKYSGNEKSSFLGLAIHTDYGFLGFKREQHILGLFTFNLDEFENEDQARAHLYHLTWHAIDLFEIRNDKQYSGKFKHGPMIPKRSPLNLAKANLQADAFSIALSHLRNETDLLEYFAKIRADGPLSTVASFKPEQYPTVIAMDACQLALGEILPKRNKQENIYHAAKNIAADIGKIFDEENIKQWWNFAIPAQDMAWRGMHKDLILSAAIHTSADPYVRAIGYQVQDMTAIESCAPESLKNYYNAFIDVDILNKIHKELVDTIFEDAIAQGLTESSNRPFLNAANQLNENLTEGRILGWCANALQDAANAFERALKTGASPDQAARMHFQGNKGHPTWETLKRLGQTIVDQKRQGFAVTMGHIAEICHDNPVFQPVLGSIKMTLSDPSYIQKLEAANDLQFKNAPRPASPDASPVPKAPTPQSPTYQANFAPTFGGPSLGGGGRRIIHQKPPPTSNNSQQDDKNQ